MWRSRVLAGCLAGGLMLLSVVPAAAMRIDGTSGDDTLIGTNADDVILGRAGDDLIVAKAGADRVQGNRGDDVLRLGPGDDQASAGCGNDVIYGGSGRDDILLGQLPSGIFDPEPAACRHGGGRDEAVTGSGNDTVRYWPPGRFTATLGPGHDTVTAMGGLKADLRGGPGRDTLFYDVTSRYTIPPHCPPDKPCRPEFTLRGARGSDSITVSFGPAALTLLGHVIVSAGPGADDVRVDGYTHVWAGRGDDTITVLGVDNRVDCGPGTDTVTIKPRGKTAPTETPVLVHCETIIDTR
jgi:Ca2+-binding RTX toxin-like protein